MFNPMIVVPAFIVFPAALPATEPVAAKRVVARKAVRTPPAVAEPEMQAGPETARDRVLRTLRSSTTGLTKSALWRANRALKASERKRAIDELTASAEIVVDVVKTGGRSRTVYRLAATDKPLPPAPDGEPSPTAAESIPAATEPSGWPPETRAAIRRS